MKDAPGIFVAGATGFIGGHLVSALRQRGLKARCLVRSKEKAALEGFEAVLGDITERETLRGALAGVRVCVHLVGIIEERGKQTFEKVHVEGTENLLDEAKRAGVGHFFYQSALGAEAASWAKYLKTKAEAEGLLKASGIPYTIFRPSLVVGPGDGFISKLMGVIASPAPFIPVPGKGKAKFQPIYVGDWVKCFFSVMDNPGAAGRVYEFGGPEHIEYNEIVKAVAQAMGVKKPLLHIPSGLAGFGIRVLEKTPFRQATSEQIRLLDTDNVTGGESVRELFGFAPIPLREALRLFISPRARGR